MDGDYTRKYATQVGNWNQDVEHAVEGLDTGRQNKEELDNLITENWYRLGRQAGSVFPLSDARLNTLHG